MAAEEKGKVVTLLDGKRSNNISIMLGRIKQTNEELRSSILEMNIDKIGEDMVKQFLSHGVASKEEASMLQDYVGSGPGVDGRVRELGKAEQFLWEMLKIPRLEQRLNAMYFKSKFLERVSDIRPDIETVHTASKNLKSSKKLVKLLELILAIGNYMNADSFRGGAYGFSLDTLGKLGDTKTANNKTTFLHYLVTVIDKKFPELKDIGVELAGIDKACKVSLPTLNAEISELQKGFSELEKEVKLPGSGVKGDKFNDNVKAFLDANRSTLEDLKTRKQEMEALFKSMVEFFGEEPKTATPETFFAVFSGFIHSLEVSVWDVPPSSMNYVGKLLSGYTRWQQKARKDNEREVEAARKAAERERAGKDTIKGKGKSNESILQTERKGVVDDLVSSLKTGEVFRAKTKIRHMRGPSMHKRDPSSRSMNTDADAAMAQMRKR
ncbi:Dishevelled associated activator of morphogenesis 2 [Borealophlyctis nickersoniae]|nr:Dishevelled associated activator of morphogenesis 2 [Borealophlyctis nickersoniae]